MVAALVHDVRECSKQIRIRMAIHVGLLLGDAIARANITAIHAGHELVAALNDVFETAVQRRRDPWSGPGLEEVTVSLNFNPAAPSSETVI